MLDRVSHKGFTARAQAVPNLSGYNLALGHRTPTERSLIGGKLCLGLMQLIEPRLSQVTGLVHVSRPMIEAAITVLQSTNGEFLEAVESERLSLLEAAILARHPRKTLVEMFVTSSRKDRADLAKIAGPAAIWDELVAPYI